MKRLIIILFLSVAWQLNAQTFEGTIKWSMKMNITDPAMKAKMAEGQQKMQDPANQAKMKELQEKMKDPQFKAMMENNPQMKAMIEKMAQGASSGDMMGSMMPKGMTVRIKGANSLTTTEGGMMPGDILHTPDKSVLIDRENKTYSNMPSGSSSDQTERTKPTITKTSETATILGHICSKYIVTLNEHGKTITSNIWTTTDFKDIDMKAFARQRMGKGQSLFYEGVEGMPLKVESIVPQGNMIMEVVDIKRESLSSSLFTIPSDYKETQGMFGGVR
ncbi:MAG: hypothetical protein OJF59_002048 [Cytophagales bacterium]|jgi:hypothetical protein|nr:DUF4412 domain-containing protein [Bacteroidota bacterium]MBS1980940.1 DUF4412 domain-containing protein [Bacteroidota bacterium]WHZ08295.1 MAG: hypothetical protein OJF59_002048 [Cytophagales bacterium]